MLADGRQKKPNTFPAEKQIKHDVDYSTSTAIPTISGQKHSKAPQLHMHTSSREAKDIYKNYDSNLS